MSLSKSYDFYAAHSVFTLDPQLLNISVWISHIALCSKYSSPCITDLFHYVPEFSFHLKDVLHSQIFT